MKNVNWDNVQDVTDIPVKGGYAARIIDVEDREENEFLLITWDFADGKYKGSNKDCFDRLGYYPHMAKVVKSYKETALRFFKGFKTSVEMSNPGFVFKNEPKSLIGKYIGVVLGEEEYQAKDGSVKTRLYTAEIRSGKAIRDGDYKIPELKKLAPGSYSAPAASVAAGAVPAAGAEFALLEDDDAQLPF